jgi:hypothetical protein
MTRRATTEHRYEKLTWPEINDAIELIKVCIVLYLDIVNVRKDLVRNGTISLNNEDSPFNWMDLFAAGPATLVSWTGSYAHEAPPHPFRCSFPGRPDVGHSGRAPAVPGNQPGRTHPDLSGRHVRASRQIRRGQPSPLSGCVAWAEVIGNETH